jgi:predicted ArsR family transcriptional regulator
LLSTVERLSDLNYRPHWEAHVEGPRIMLGNCPYYNILDDHPELCDFDKLLIEELISNSVEQIAKLNMDERNIPYCMFRVRE